MADRGAHSPSSGKACHGTDSKGELKLGEHALSASSVITSVGWYLTSWRTNTNKLLYIRRLDMARAARKQLLNEAMELRHLVGREHVANERHRRPSHAGIDQRASCKTCDMVQKRHSEHLGYDSQSKLLK